MAIHAAVRSLSAELDKVDLSVPLIAARAGVTPSTIYRRWGNLSELLSDVALERLRPSCDPVDTGSAHGDLVAWGEQYAEEMSSPVGRSILRDLFSGAAEAGNPAQCCALSREQLAIIRERAVARGEPAFDVEEVIDLVVAPILYRILLQQAELGADYLAKLLARLRSVSSRDALSNPEATPARNDLAMADRGTG